MIMHTMKTMLSNNLTLKLCAIGIGYGIWLIASQAQLVTFNVHVPVCIQNQPHTWHVATPTMLKLILKAPRAEISFLNRRDLAVHIDCETLTLGNNHVAITNENLYIPDNMKVVYYSPFDITVSLKQDLV